MRGIAAALVVAAIAGCASVPPPSANRYADRVVVEKSKRLMHLMQNGKVLKTYYVALGGNPVGHKRQRGDRRTPEGEYIIDLRRPESRFSLALRISYPGPADRQYAALRGVDPGDDIYIHGEPAGGVNPARLAALGADWTDGCIAVSNAQMREIWAMVRVGTPVEIRP